MSKKGARRARTAAKAPPPVKGKRSTSSNRFWLYVSAGVLVIVAAVALIVASLVGGDDKKTPPAAIDGTATQQLLGGIPQKATALGSPDAPVTLVEFADPQCPFCAKFDVSVLPELIDKYVTTGKLRVEYRALPIIGPDSSTGLKAIYAAGNQAKAWNMTDLLYQNQGGENDGWLTEPFVKTVAQAIPGLDVDTLMKDLESQQVNDAIRMSIQDAQSLGFDTTPSFQIGPTGGELTSLGPQKLEVENFTKLIDEQLGS